jgi:hypothetical protein
MASRLVELNEAAKMLGLTPDQVIEMRSNGEIFGYRDGASWKFKVEEVERVKAELAGGGTLDDGPISFDDDPNQTHRPPGGLPEDDAVLVQEEEGEPAGGGSRSKVIGASGEAPDAESDLRLSGLGSDLVLEADSAISLEGDEEISLDDGSSRKGSPVDSDVSLVPGVGIGSDVRLVPDTGSDRALKAPSAGSAEVLGDSELKLKSGSSGGTGEIQDGGGTSRSLGPVGSGDLDIALDSELALSDDDEMVLGGSAIGSDLTLNPAADSGINLASPSDSGLSLEADSGISLQTPTDSGLSLEEESGGLGGSSISALELPEDESIELDSGALESDQDLKRDDEFQLSPADEVFADESDSGSQVIAIEDSATFEQEVGEPLQANLLEAASSLSDQVDALGGGPAPVATPLAGPLVGGPLEAPHSWATISGLLAILLFLSLTGVLMSDIVRNMWAWEDGMDVSSSISEGVSSAIFK